MRIESILRGIYLKLYFFFKKKMLFTDGYNLKYYLYKNTRPNDTFNLGVRTDDTTVLYTIDKILTSPSLTKGEEIHCFDVGGYIGIVTLMMSKVLNNIKKKWKIHTFEPFEDSFKKLQENINLDSSNKNIELNYVAVSDVPGTSTLETYQDTPGENHLKIYNLNNDQPSISFKNIKVITLRDYINKNNIKNIAICKVDTEGADYFNHPDIAVDGVIQHGGSTTPTALNGGAGDGVNYGGGIVVLCARKIQGYGTIEASGETTTGGGVIFIVSQDIPLTGVLTDVTGYASGTVKTFKV